MNKFAIVADSSHNLSLEDCKTYGIYLLKYNIKLGDKTYEDLTEIDTRHFYKIMGNYDYITTGIPSPDTAQSMIDQIKKDGYKDILCFCSSKKVTGMYNMLEMIKRQNPDVNMKVVDTHIIVMAAGFQAIYASMLRDQGMNLDEVYQIIMSKQDDAYAFALFRTLEYVIKGGRLSPLKGAVGKLLNIQPILYEDDGTVGVKELVRGKKNSMNVLIDYIKKEINVGRKYFMNIFSGDNDEERAFLKEALADEIERADLFTESELTPLLGVHAGPGSVGCSFYFID